MIQRKQTLFLLAVAVIAIVMFFAPFIIFDADGVKSMLCLLPGCNPEIMSTGAYAPFILNILVLVLSIVAIFLYKNRVLQYKVANLVALLNVFIIGLFFLLTYIKEGVTGTISYSFGAFLPILSIICAFLAAHFIKKDEQLVRNADRIR